jgi:hypothetical protein
MSAPPAADCVREVSDGEEMVLWRGETFLVRANPDGAAPVTALLPAKPAAATRIAIQYRGFQDVAGRRQYALHAQSGDRTSHYTVCIELAAFARREALLQDGPDISYQKLLRELGGSVPPGSDSIEVTAGDLAAYRETHAAPVRKSFSASRNPQPARAEADAPAVRAAGEDA